MVVYSATEFMNLPNFHILKHEVNKLSSEAFDHTTINDNVTMILNKNGYIGYLMLENNMVACGFGEDDTSNPSSKYKTMYIHTFGVNKEYRGRGLCRKIVSEFIKKFGKNYILYLTVRTEPDNVNENAIKCYEKSGFIMLPQVYRDHYDGKNSGMIRLPNSSKNSIRTRRRRKTKKKKK